VAQEDRSSGITGASNLRFMEGREGASAGAGRLVGSAALITAGVLLEPELIGGALLGAGVVYGFPFIGRVLRPIVNTAVWLGYSAVAAVSDVASQAGQQIQSSVAEARRQYDQSASRTGTPMH
jgi:hypothetical protein